MHHEVLITLIFGVVLGGAASYISLKQRSVTIMVESLLCGAAFVLLALLGLTGFMAPAWVGVSRNAVFGILLIFMSIRALHEPPSPRFPEWTKWAFLVFGIGSIGGAVLLAYAVA